MEVMDSLLQKMFFSYKKIIEKIYGEPRKGKD